MKQQFVGLFHCKCGTSWQRDIVSASYCTTRLRFEVKDYRQVNEQAVKAAGATASFSFMLQFFQRFKRI